MSRVKRKPLSFTTTMRNPDRIAGFITCLLSFEGQILTNNLIHSIVKSVLAHKLYETMYQIRNPNFHAIFNSDDMEYSDAQIESFILNAPQQHKEAGFDAGWPSRFDTWFKFPKELGFIYYEIDSPIQISTTGHLLANAFQENPPNGKNIQDIFLNALARYQTNNPFRRNLNSNVPLILLLQVITLLHNDPTQNGAGLFRQELSLLICWPDNDAQALYNYIIKMRKTVGFNYSDEYMYERCLKILGATNAQRNYYKMSQICGEAVDEYIRKMRSTGVISLRGHGRFIDINTLENDKINHILNNYATYSSFNDCRLYSKYMGTIDPAIITPEKPLPPDTTDIRNLTLRHYAKDYSSGKIFDELRLVCNKKESRDDVFKFIAAPTRLEFLTSIAMVQNFPDANVKPNYAVDDEGLPTFTAGGNGPDIVCFDTQTNSLVEVTLMCGRQDQVNNEMIPIRRHLLNYKALKSDTFSVFVAPIIHEDTVEAAAWYKHRENIDIKVFDIENFISTISKALHLANLL